MRGSMRTRWTKHTVSAFLAMNNVAKWFYQVDAYFVSDIGPELLQDAESCITLVGVLSIVTTIRLPTEHPKVWHAIKLVVLAMILWDVAVVKRDAIRRLPVEHTKGVEKR